MDARNLLMIVCGLMMLALFGVFASNTFRRRYDVLSLRNLFILGFIHFYCLGSIFLMRGLSGGWFRLDSGYLPSSEGLIKLAILIPVFVAVLLLFAKIGFGWGWLAKKVPNIQMSVSAPTIWSSIVVLMAVALLFSVVQPGGYIGLLGGQFANGTAAAAFGLSVYYALSRRLSPMAWGLAAATFLVGAVASTVGGSGRRFLLSLLLVAPWVIYFARMRYSSSVRLATIIGVGAAVSLVLVLLYSRTRGAEDRDAASRIGQLVEVVTNPMVSLNTIQHTLYTDTSYNTMFILENYPEEFEYQPLQGAYWLVTNPVPRSLWAGKPAALGESLRDQMDTDANLGPGVIGHGWSEAGVVGVLYYAVFFGLLFGVLDRTLAERALNPFFLVVLGANLGNVIALPRGDTPLFMIQTAAAAVSTFVLLWLVKLAVDPVGRAFPSLQIIPPSLAPPPVQPVGPDHAGEAGYEQPIAAASY